MGLLEAENLILAGDLNLTTSPKEMWGEKASIDPLLRFFNHIFYKNSLVDMKPAELLPTWTNWRLGPAGIAKRLDQFLIAEELLLPSYNVQALVNLPFLSAHAPICLQIGDGRFDAGQPFKFNPQWLREDSFNSLIRLPWVSPGSVRVVSAKVI